MSADDARNIAQMHVRLARYLPRDLATKVSPAHIDKSLRRAWDNGWRDPEWLATYALEGTGMESVTNAAALFTARLNDACETPCPTENVTPTPPSVEQVKAEIHGRNTPAENPSMYAGRIRAELAARSR